MIIIPARLASSRFANKVLADILGLPMVIKTAFAVKDLDDVVIATDSEEVVKVAKQYNINAIMTSAAHQSGTDRINEAANILGLGDDEIVVNVQADEPFIEPNIIATVIEKTKLIMDSRDFTMVSLCKQINSELADDPNLVKVILDAKSDAIYFSRSKIPYNRDHHHDIQYFGHLGIYSFAKKSLNEFCSLGAAPLEHIEKLEQLRAIYNHKKIAMAIVESKSFGIDTEEDLKKAIEVFG